MNDLNTLLEGFCIHLQAAGRRPSTILWYTKHVNRFLAWLESEDIPAVTEHVTVLQIRQFVVHQQSRTRAWQSNPYVPTQDRNLSSSYIQASVKALRAWYNWMEAEEYIEANPMSKVRTPKQQQRIIEPLEKDEIKRLLKCMAGQTPTAYRNRAMILVLLDTGLRVGELCHLETQDVDIHGGWIRVRRGKGWKERKVPCGGALRKALWHYASHRPEPMGGSKAFFLTDRGWPVRPDRIRKLLLYYGKKANIANLHPHRFRHTFALHFLRHGGDSLTLKMLLGHASLQMVNRYVHLASVDLKAAHAKASPADHLRL